MGIIDNPLTFLKGIGWGMAIVIIWSSFSDPPPPDLGQMQRRVAGYELCMRSAGSLRCHMGPEDFVDYYDLKYRILQIEEGK